LGLRSDHAAAATDSSGVVNTHPLANVSLVVDVEPVGRIGDCAENRKGLRTARV
jgi:hypothetical protein